MTKAQFIASVEADSNFRKWATVPAVLEVNGTIEKWMGVAYISTPDGANLFNVFFIWDKSTDTAEWQNANQLSPAKNTDYTKMDALQAYLKSKYSAYFLGQIDFANQWAEATVYTLTTGKLVKKNVLVFKQGTNPISDLDVI